MSILYKQMQRVLTIQRYYPKGIEFRFPEFVRSIPDTSGGPPMPSIEFNIGNGHTLLVTDSFYGMSYTVNPGPRNLSLEPSDIPDDVHKYIYEAFKREFGDPIKRTGG